MRDDCGKRSTLPEEPKRGRMNRAVAAGGSKPRMHSSEAGCPENQLRQLRQWCVNAGHQLVHEYVDRESGRKGVNGRKQFAALLEDAHKRKFDCVLFWALDRFTREGTMPTIMHLAARFLRRVLSQLYRAAPGHRQRACASCSPCWPHWPSSRRRKYPSAPEPAWLEPRHRASASVGQAFHTSRERRSLSEARQARRPTPVAKALGIDRHTA